MNISSPAAHMAAAGAQGMQITNQKVVTNPDLVNDTAGVAAWRMEMDYWSNYYQAGVQAHRTEMTMWQSFIEMIRG